MTKKQMQSYEFPAAANDVELENSPPSEKTYDYCIDKVGIREEFEANVDFERALESTQYGKFNILLIVVCGLALLGVNVEGYSIGYVLPSAECDLKLTTYTKGVLSSANFIGIMGSCCIWGYLADIKGRKNILAITFLCSFVTSLAAALTPSFWGFTILRFLNGISISGPSAIIFAYFGEFHSKQHRSTSMAAASFFIAFALIELPGLAWLLLPQSIHINLFDVITINSWRLFMLINAAPSAIVALAFLKLPESPKYLYHSGNATGALDVLRRIYAINTGRPADAFPVKSLQVKALQQENSRTKSSILRVLWRQISPLFMVPNLKYTLAACLIQGGLFAVSSGLLLWYPDIINQLAKNSKTGGGGLTVCQALSYSNSSAAMAEACEATLDDEIFLQNINVGVAYLFSYALWGMVVRFLGNRNVFVSCMVISSAAILLVEFLVEKIVIDVLFVLLLTLPGICVAVINLELVDIVPTHLCGMAVCIIMTAGRLGSIVSSAAVGVMLQWNCEVTFALYGASLIGCLLLMLVFPKHSK